MTIDLDEMADIAIDAAFDDYEGSGIFTKDRAKAAAKKALREHAKVTPGYGGMDIGTFMSLGDGVHVYRNAQMRMVDPPLLPDGD